MLLSIMARHNAFRFLRTRTIASLANVRAHARFRLTQRHAPGARDLRRTGPSWMRRQSSAIAAGARTLLIDRRLAGALVAAMKKLRRIAPTHHARAPAARHAAGRDQSADGTHRRHCSRSIALPQVRSTVRRRSRVRAKVARSTLSALYAFTAADGPSLPALVDPVGCYQIQYTPFSGTRSFLLCTWPRHRLANRRGIARAVAASISKSSLAASRTARIIRTGSSRIRSSGRCRPAAPVSSARPGSPAISSRARP